MSVRHVGFGDHSRGFFKRITEAFKGWSVDPKKLQFDKDLHNLHMLTALHEHTQGGGDDDADTISQVAETAATTSSSYTTEELFQRVNRSISLQLLGLAETMFGSTSSTGSQHPDIAAAPDEIHSQEPMLGRRKSSGAVLQKPSPKPEQVEKEGEGTGHVSKTKFFKQHKAMQSAALTEWLQQIQPYKGSDGLTRSQYCHALAEELGFQLQVRKSSIDHAAAGNGLWLQGQAGYGTVVALHPGVVYPQIYHSEMAEYPNVTKGNDFILSRYDGALIDAKPWGLGRADDDSAWPDAATGVVDAALAALEGRHPLALGHYINHPPLGTAPNVLLAPFNITLDGDFRRLRPHFPYVTCDASPAGVLGERVSGLALIAQRPLQDEELFVDYRLNPFAGPRPDWYHPIDKTAERRRWGG